MTGTEFTALAAQRRSCRAYRGELPPRELLEAVLAEAQLAPSARNLQPWHFTVITDPELIAELETGVGALQGEGRRSIFYGAPAVILVSGDGANPWNQIDCGLATQNLLLSATARGLGTCVIGYVMGYLRDASAAGTLARLALPEGYAPLFGVAIGYPAGESAARPRENKVSWR